MLVLAHFLECFEGKNHANFSAKEGCAAEAGIDLKAADRCFADETLREKLWDEQLALKERSRLTFFPTVLLNGEVMNGNQTLVQNICGLLTGSRPAECTDTPPLPPPPPPPENPCLGHRCDTGACPCGCECGNDKDPGLCYVPE